MMTAYETKKIIYETIVKEIYINPETAYALTQVIYKNLKDAEQGNCDCEDPLYMELISARELIGSESKNE